MGRAPRTPDQAVWDKKVGCGRGRALALLGLVEHGSKHGNVVTALLGPEAPESPA
jgi:hypothetical protein